eukprot:8160112-Lingulodinium_polyedra.AAC.1
MSGSAREAGASCQQCRRSVWRQARGSRNRNRGFEARCHGCGRPGASIGPQGALGRVSLG